MLLAFVLLLIVLTWCFQDIGFLIALFLCLGIGFVCAFSSNEVDAKLRTMRRKQSEKYKVLRDADTACKW